MTETLRPIRLEVRDGQPYADGQLLPLLPQPDGSTLEPEQAAIAWVAQIARTMSRPIPVVATPEDGVELHLEVTPDGASRFAEHDGPAGADDVPGHHMPPDAASVPKPPVVDPHPAGASAGAPARASALAHPGHEQPHLPASAIQIREPGSTLGPIGAHRAQQGWRGRLVRSTGVPLPPAAAERSYLQDLADAQTQLPGGRTITIVNPAGAVGKTTSALLLSAALGTSRGGGVLALEVTRGRGTMLAHQQLLARRHRAHAAARGPDPHLGHRPHR